MIAGEPGSYKTWLALALAKSVSSGERFLERQTNKTKVYYIDRENPKRLLINRLDLVGRAEGFNLWGLWVNPEPPSIFDPEYIKRAEGQPVIIFDSLIKFHNGDENSAKDMAKVSKALARLRDAGATVVVLHHKGKGQGPSYRGSSEILGGVDVAFSLSKGNGGEKLLSLKGIKNRFVQEQNITLEVISDETSLTFVDVSREKERVKKFEEKERMLEIQNIIKELFKELGKYPNQREVLEKAKDNPHIGSYHMILELLDAGKGKFWKTEDGTRGAKLYYVDN